MLADIDALVAFGSSQRVAPKAVRVQPVHEHGQGENYRLEIQPSTGL